MNAKRGLLSGWDYVPPCLSGVHVFIHKYTPSSILWTQDETQTDRHSRCPCGVVREQRGGLAQTSK